MKEAIANAGIFNLVIMFVIILLAFFIGSLSYSKAFKVKNKILEEIEKDQGYTMGSTDSTEARVEDWIRNIGYRANVGHNRNTRNCANTVSGNGGSDGVLINGDSNYQYCVYEFDTCSGGSNLNCGKYYRVIAYMYFDIPIISGLLRLPVSGETMIFNEIDT